MKNLKTILFMIGSIIVNVSSFVLAFLDLGEIELPFAKSFLFFLFFVCIDILLAQYFKKEKTLSVIHTALSFFTVVLIFPFQLAKVIPMVWVYILYLISSASLLLFTQTGKDEIHMIRHETKKNIFSYILLFFLFPSVVSFFLGFLHKQKSI